MRDGPSGQLDGERFGTEALAVACAAERGGHVLGHPLAIGIGAGFLEITLEEFQNSLEAETFFGPRFLDGWSVAVFSGTRIRRRIAVQKQVLGARGKFLEWGIENKPVRIGGEFQSALEVSGAGARAETSIKERARPVHDDLGGIEIVFRAEAMAIRARAVWRIKTEGARLKLRNGDSTIGAG